MDLNETKICSRILRTMFVLFCIFTITDTLSRVFAGESEPSIKEIEIGIIAPQLDLINLRNNSEEIKINKGKNYIINFISPIDPRLDGVAEYFTNLTKKYDGSLFDIVFIFEPDAAKKNEVFLEKLKQNIHFKTGIDKNGNTIKNYGIKNLNRHLSILIDANNKVVWYGDAFNGLDDIVEKLLTGKVDVEKLRKSFLLKKLADEYFLLARTASATNRIVELGEKILNQGGDDPLLLNEFAWNIMTDEKLKYRDLLLALRASRKACDIVKGTQPALLDTYARALFMNGQIKDAIQIQQLAIELSTDPKVRKQLEQTLKIYNSAIKK